MGNSIYSVRSIKEKDKFLVQLNDGKITANVDSIKYDTEHKKRAIARQRYLYAWLNGRHENLAIANVLKKKLR